MPQVSFASTSKPGTPHVRGHSHNEDFSRSDYVNYEQIKEKMRKGAGVPYEPLWAPWAFDDKVLGHHRYQPKEYKPDPHYRHRAWWREPAIRPWEHEDLLVHSRPTRGSGQFNPWILSTSENAPWSTYHDPEILPKTDGIVIPTWEKDEHQHIHMCKYEVMGRVKGRRVRKPGDENIDLGMDYDHHSNPKEPRLTAVKYPDNKWNESPWNRKPGETKFRPMSPPPPKPPIIRESSAFAAPFSTRDNKVVVKYGDAQPTAWNNRFRRAQRDPYPIDVETRWPFERHEDDPHGKLPRRFKSFPRDIKTYEWQPFPHADEPKLKGNQHCNMKEGHGIKHQFYPGDPRFKSGAGDFGRVVYPPKIISYPRDPATYVPFPVHYAYEPEDKSKEGHCGMKQGHDRGFRFYPGDPSKMPAAGQKVPPKVYPPTWDVKAPYMYESYVPFY